MGRLAILVGRIPLLLRHKYDHWARKRIDEGWHYGAKRNDDAKEHPDLVPYDQLPESEKEYDRKTVIEVLNAIIALGCEVRSRVHKDLLDGLPFGAKENRGGEDSLKGSFDPAVLASVLREVEIVE